MLHRVYDLLTMREHASQGDDRVHVALGGHMDGTMRACQMFSLALSLSLSLDVLSIALRVALR